MSKLHKLGNIIYDARFDTKELALGFQSTAASFIQDKLLVVVNEVCDELDNEMEVIRIDTLEFDLGRFNYRNSEEEIKERLRKELYKILQQKIAEISRNPSEDENILVKEKSEYLHLIHYLQRGSLTWNGGFKNSETLERVLGNSLKKERDEFVKWLRQHGRMENIRKRIVYQFKDIHIIKIIERLDSKNAPFITEYASELKYSHKKEPFVPITEIDFRNSTWEVILAYLLTNAGSRFNRKTFVKYTLQQIAIRHSIDYRKLLATFSRSIPKLLKNKVIKTEFPEIIIELHQEYNQLKDSEQFARETKAREKGEWIGKIIGFLQGKLKKIKTSTLESLAKNYPDELGKLLNQYLLKKSSREKFLELLTEDQFKVLVRLLEPIEFDFIILFAGILELDFEKKEIKHTKTSVRKIKWQVIVVYLLEAHNSSFNRKAFIRNTIKEISSRCSYSYKEVMLALYHNVRKKNQKVEKAKHLTEILSQLQDEAFIEYQKRILPDEAILQILNNYELFDEIIFYVHYGYQKRNFASTAKHQGIKSILYNLESAAPELILNYLGYVQDEKHLRLLVNNTDREFVELTALLFMKRYFSSSEENVMKFQKAIRSTGKKVSDKSYYLRILTLLITQREKNAESIIKALNLSKDVEHGKKSKQSFSILSLKSELVTFLKGGKKRIGSGPDYETYLHQLMEFYPDQFGIVIKYVLGQPHLFESFLRMSNNKLLFSVLNAYSPTVYTQNYVKCITESFGLKKQTHPNKLKVELWRIVFESIMDTGPKDELDIAGNLLSKFMLSINDAVYKEKSIAALNKNIRSFNSMDKHKTLAIINDVEKRLQKNKLETGSIQEKDIQKTEIALVYLRGEKIDSISQIRLLEYIARFFKDNPEQASRFLIRHLYNVRVRQFWLAKLPESLLMKILFLLVPGEFIAIHSISEIVWEASSLVVSREQRKVLSGKWHYVFETLVRCKFNNGFTHFSGSLIRQILRDIQEHGKKAFLKDVCIELASKTRSSKKEMYLEVITEIKKVARNSMVGKEIVVEGEKDATINMYEQTEKSDDWEEDNQDSLYIHNAGMVLAAPAIQPLFIMLKLVEDNQFIDDKAADKAIHLLQYMIDESIAAPEFLLLLNKIICGVDLERPVQLDVEITDHEKACVDQVIKDIILHWKVLQNTTVEGFREIFLQRDGALRLMDEWWELQVEAQPFDMLIDQIPWNYSTIKYPWMYKPLYVKWR